MLIGKMPNPVFLAENGLEKEYGELAQIVIQGDIFNFDGYLEEQMEVYIKAGVYLCVDKLRFLVQRNLIKKMACQIMKNPGNYLPPLLQQQTHVVPFGVFLPLFQKFDPDFSEEDMEMLLAKLINGNFIKGYLISDKKVIVFAKDIGKAFPQDGSKYEY